MYLTLPLLSFVLLLLVNDSEQCGISMCGMSGGGGGGCCPPPPMMMSCCGGGGGGGCGKCTVKRRQTATRMKREAKHQTVTLEPSPFDDPVCSDPALRRTMEKNMLGDAHQSAEAIHEALSAENMDHFAVFCTKDFIAYLADAQRYCLHSNQTTGETCFAVEH